jgi:hypothetical protein
MARRVGSDPGSPDVPLAGPPMAPSPRQSRGSPTSPHRRWPLDKWRSGTFCTRFRRVRLVPRPSASTRRPRAAATTPRPNLPERSRRPSEARARKRESRGTQSAREAAARARRIHVLGVPSHPQASLLWRPLVATGSPPMPTTGESRGPVAPARKSPWIPVSWRSGEGGGPDPRRCRRCRDRGRAVDPGCAVHASSPRLPLPGQARAPQPGKPRDLPVERDMKGTLVAGVGPDRDRELGPVRRASVGTCSRDSSHNIRWPAMAGHRLLLLGFRSTTFIILFRRPALTATRTALRQVKRESHGTVAGMAGDPRVRGAGPRWGRRGTMWGRRGTEVGKLGDPGSPCAVPCGEH